jgi:hypothetical protein
MKAAVAVVLTLTLSACFPNSAKHRTYAKIGEGAALATGIGILYVANSGADCDESRMVGVESSCRTNASIIGTVGLGLILAGMTGFIATISTSPDENDTPKPTPITTTEGEGTTAAPAARTAEKPAAAK